MKFLTLILAYCLLTAYSFAQDKQAAFKKQIKSFTKVAQGFYEVRPQGDNIPEAQRQPQDLLMFPITHWNTDTEAWFCFVWLSPKFKDKPLEQVLIRLTYKDEQTMDAGFYTIPNNAPEGLLYEWKKAKPFSPMTADFVMSESFLCKGFISLGTDGVYKMESYEPCPRDTKGAGYTAIKVDSRFYGKTYTSGVRFYTPEGKIIIEHNHEFQSKKASSNLKKY